MRMACRRTRSEQAPAHSSFPHIPTPEHEHHPPSFLNISPAKPKASTDTYSLREHTLWSMKMMWLSSLIATQWIRICHHEAFQTEHSRFFVIPTTEHNFLQKFSWEQVSVKRPHQRSDEPPTIRWETTFRTFSYEELAENDLPNHNTKSLGGFSRLWINYIRFHRNLIRL